MAGKDGTTPPGGKGEPASPVPKRPGERRAEIVKTWLNGSSGAAAGRALGVSRQRVDRAIGSLFAIDGLTAACAERGVDAAMIADVISDAMRAERTLVIPDGKGGAVTRQVEDHPTRLKAAHLLIDVELKLKQLAQTVEIEQAEVIIDGVDLSALGRDELTALVMRRSVRRLGA